MTRDRRVGTGAKWLAVSAGLAGAAYGALVATAWWRYGQPKAAEPDARDALLDRYMPDYDVVERHHIRVAAPAEVTLGAAADADLQASLTVRAIIKAREIMMGATPDNRPRPRGLLAEVQALGWGMLAEVSGREIVMGAVTRPWEANVRFRALPPDEFAAFSEPGHVKIAWTLRADPVGEQASIFRTETRVCPTDPIARSTFRRYWSFVSPGIVTIRWALLGPVKREAERRARAVTAGARKVMSR
jgi:hypothetical protein